MSQTPPTLRMTMSSTSLHDDGSPSPSSSSSSSSPPSMSGHVSSAQATKSVASSNSSEWEQPPPPVELARRRCLSGGWVEGAPPKILPRRISDDPRRSTVSSTRPADSPTQPKLRALAARADAARGLDGVARRGRVRVACERDCKTRGSKKGARDAGDTDRRGRSRRADSARRGRGRASGAPASGQP